MFIIKTAFPLFSPIDTIVGDKKTINFYWALFTSPCFIGHVSLCILNSSLVLVITYFSSETFFV